MPEISLSDPAVEPPIHPSVCRSLNFGKCRRKEDDDQFLRREFESIRKSDQSKWNFDFYNEKPLKGQFEWRRVTRSQKKVIDCCRLPYGDHS